MIKPTKLDGIVNGESMIDFFNRNIDEIKKIMKKDNFKTEYQKNEEKYGYEEKIRQLCPCNECLVKMTCKERNLNVFREGTNCEKLGHFKNVVLIVILVDSYEESADFFENIIEYTTSKIDKGEIKSSKLTKELLRRIKDIKEGYC